MKDKEAKNAIKNVTVGLLAAAVCSLAVFCPGNIQAAETKQENAGPVVQEKSEEVKTVSIDELAGEKKGMMYAIIPAVDDTVSAQVLTPAGIMSIYQNKATEEEYLKMAGQQDAMFSAYKNLGIANVSDTLNIRKEPSESASLAGRLPSNAVCNIESVEGDWTYVTSGEVKGYVKSCYLASGAEARKMAEKAIQTEATVHVEEGNLTVRTEPCENGGILTAVADGETLDVEEALGNWVRIDLDNHTAYVNARYVTLEKSLKTAMTVSELIYGPGVTSIRGEICSYAQQFIGNPYVWGGTSLTHGADCSGYVQTIYATYGIYLPRVAASQALAGKAVRLADAQPGDLVFYSTGGHIDHVAIYIGNGQVVNAASKRSGICIKGVSYRTVTKVVRVIDIE